ncbi:MAG: patatin-like phospholipase family protein [Pseudomonadota bacterium]
MDVVLALGGGGVKGVGHICVLEALDDLGIRPKAIAGTSAGALVGSAYSAGFSGAELRAHVRRLSARKAATAWEIIRDPRNRGGLIDPEAFYDLGVPEGMPARFEDLVIPFTAIATDFYGHSCVEYAKGPLRPAVSASIAIPGLFAPVRFEGRTLMDGGLVRNLPVLSLPEGFTIAVDVLDYPTPGSGEGRRHAAMGALRIMMKNINLRDLEVRKPDVLLVPDTAGAGPLDIFRMADILNANAGLRDTVKRAIDQAIGGT